ARVAEDHAVRNPEPRGGPTHLRSPNAADFLWLSALPIWTEPPALAASSRREIRLDSLSRVFGDRPAEAERFIVGMGQNGHQSQFTLQRNLPRQKSPAWLRQASAPFACP